MLSKSSSNLADIVWGNRDSEQIALVDAGPDTINSRLSYGDVQQAIQSFPKEFRGKSGLEPGHRVAVVGKNQSAHVLASYGLMHGGYVAVPVNLQLSHEALEHIYRVCDIAATLADRAGLEALPASLASSTRLLALDEPTFYAGREPRPATQGGDDEAVVMFTSGSTGLPKAVPITHNGYLWAMRQFADLIDSLAGQTVLAAAPLFHMNAQFHVQAALAGGATAVVMRRFEAGRFLELIVEESVTRVTGVPTMLALAVREADRRGVRPMRHVQSVAMGSAPLSEALVQEVKSLFPEAVISNGYGTTETGPALFGAHPDGIPTPVQSIGYPLAKAGWDLRDGSDKSQGVLWVKHPMTATGYLGDVAQTEAAFRDGWYCTKDRMVRDEDGFFYFDGRADDMFVCAGENIYPQEVERRMLQHPAVRDVAVVPVPDELKGYLPVAFVVAENTDEATLRDHALRTGPAYAHPRAVYFLDQLPLGSTNKVDRQKLQRLAEQTFQR